MLHHLALLAAAPAPTGGGGLDAWIRSHIVSLVITVVALGVMMKAQKKDHAGAISSVAILVVGLMVLGMATGTHASDVGNWAATTLSNWATGA